jgi:ribosome-binding protein aMBF1 (putative translation factor)
MNYLQNINKSVDKCGMKKKYLAEQLNITYDTFRRKLSGEQEFKLNELLTLTTIINIKITEVFENEVN